MAALRTRFLKGSHGLLDLRSSNLRVFSLSEHFADVTRKRPDSGYRSMKSYLISHRNPRSSQIFTPDYKTKIRFFFSLEKVIISSFVKPSRAKLHNTFPHIIFRTNNNINTKIYLHMQLRILSYFQVLKNTKLGPMCFVILFKFTDVV